MQDYKYAKSSASCKLADITGIIYGGFSSRFWMLRKHMNCLDIEYNDERNIPFYSWQCITIQMKDRDVDLVIPKEKDMDQLITILIHAMETVDGTKGSRIKLEKTIIKEKNR